MFQVFTTLFACIFSYLWYAFSRKTELVYEDPLVDFVPINAAVLVLIKQVEDLYYFWEERVSKIIFLESKYFGRNLFLVLKGKIDKEMFE